MLTGILSRLRPALTRASPLSTRASPLLTRTSPACLLRPQVQPRPGLLARLCSGSAQIEEQYAKPLQWLHWVYAAGFTTVMGTVAASRQTSGPTFLGTKGQTKGTLMMVHKSTAVVLAVLVVPRMLIRALSKAPQMLPGSFVEHFAANVSHIAMYGYMLAMPATGLAMGYFGGKGVPFYGVYIFPGKADKTKEDGAFAGKMFKWHTQAGSLLWYLLPIHVGGALMHTLRGHKIWVRINPLGRA